MILKPRFHGNGFIQVYLNELTRLHIWSQDLPATRVQNARIHDHRFTFISQVLLGALIDVRYAVKIGTDCEHTLYQQGPTFSDKSSPLEYYGECDIEKISERRIVAGESYGVGGPSCFHDTIPADGRLTVSVMTKTATLEGYRARIVSLEKKPIEHAFENQPDAALLKRHVKMALNRIV